MSLVRACILPTICIIPTAIVCSVIAQTTYPPLLQLSLGGFAVLLLYAAPLARWWIARIKDLQSVPTESSPLKMNEVNA